MVRRIYVEKKEAYAIKAKELQQQIQDYLWIKQIKKVRCLIRYDIEGLSEELYQNSLYTIFSEPPVDLLYEENFPMTEGEVSFSVAYLSGQFDQRADSAKQCVQLLGADESVQIRSAITYVFSGEITEEILQKLKQYCINPVDSMEISEEKPETLQLLFEQPNSIPVLDGFCHWEEERLQKQYEALHLAMTMRDFQLIQTYFREEEKRDPSMTEIRVLDTYWSDHCRHTTFSTELRNVTFTEGAYQKPLQESFYAYQQAKCQLEQQGHAKPITLMDVALMGMKELRAKGKLQEMEQSEEINACSIVVPLEIDGQQEEWLLFFKNETHNHPTEIEPFGGAATCLGGAIRDPLSGRGYVYQAMRITGAADPTRPPEDTLPGKLPQRKIVTESANGYSSYGNQIGLATGLVQEIYHPGYVAKRMEIGAVLGAAPRKNVIRESAKPGDQIVLLGGRTGRDGCGGATGSSKAHTEQSIAVCGAEVQKGNPPVERKIQRLFRNPKVSCLIKKCNDFGAGGVSVAIGELADGLQIDLDKVPKKYEGLDGTELAISESQERMAVVLDPKDVAAFLQFAEEENLEAIVVAEVTEQKRLVMNWRGQQIVNLSRAFLDTNGATQITDVIVESPKKEHYFQRAQKQGWKEDWLQMLQDFNVCSQKGLVERFDSSIGAATVVMPYGGKTQRTPVQTMIAKLPVQTGDCDLVSMMSYGFDPYLASFSPYHGAVYAVLSSIAKIVAAGGDYHKIYFTFQEYFEKMGDDPAVWGKPLAALLGAYEVQRQFELAAIGGKDSMSGTFQEKTVPPTLVSFAVATGQYDQVITPECKQAGHVLIRLQAKRDMYDLPCYEQIKQLYTVVYQMVQKNNIFSAYAIGFGGMAEAISKMLFGNGFGIRLSEQIEPEEYQSPDYGSLLIELQQSDVSYLEENGLLYDVVGIITEQTEICYRGMKITQQEAIHAFENALEGVFSTKTKPADEKPVSTLLYQPETILIAKHKVAKPTVFIPVFPGTNCEYDTEKAFLQAGAKVNTVVFKNLTSSQIQDSVDAFVKAIQSAQILMIPGGFSAGDEPDGSGKFIATVFRNERVKEAVHALLQTRDGLCLGICNGFQALMKLGLLPYGKIVPMEKDTPTLTTNRIGRHCAKVVHTKVVSHLSPWLQKTTLGGIYTIPVSHGEGRFVANPQWIEKLRKNGQIATQYVTEEGVASMAEDVNPNGSYEAIEGITSEDGRVFGKMGHSERSLTGITKNIVGNQNQPIFASGVAYFQS